nr:MAG TPA: hypothetical protein [Caudoviricetes sp.]
MRKGVLCMVELLLAILLVVAITEAVKYIKK